MQHEEKLLAVLVVLTALSCGDKRAAPSPREKSPQTASAHNASITKDVVAKDAVAKEPGDFESSVEERLRAWLNAQNSGDFDAYKALYATNFQGVRTSGKKRVELDREAWFKDRARMFEKQMKVIAAEPNVSRSADTVTVEFVQTWRSGTYADIGEKRIVLRDEGGALLIVSEEMLTSEKLATDVAVAAPVLFFRTAPGRFAVPLGDAREKLRLAHRGDPKMSVVEKFGKSIERVERAVIASSLPISVRETIGAELEVFDAKGKPCRARVRGFFENRTHTLRLMGNKRDGMLEAGKLTELAGQLWPEMRPGPLLIATARVAEPCDGLWARKAGAPTPAIGVELKKPDETLTKQARGALTKTKDYAESADREDEKWAVEHADGEPASSRERYRDEWELGLEITVKVFGVASGPPSLAVLTWTEGERLVFRVGAAGKLTRLDPSEDYCPGPTRSVVDLNGDGTLDILAAVPRVLGGEHVASQAICPTFVFGDKLKSVWQTE